MLKQKYQLKIIPNFKTSNQLIYLDDKSLDKSTIEEQKLAIDLDKKSIKDKVERLPDAASINIEVLLEMPGDEDQIEANLYGTYETVIFDVKPKKKRPRRKHSAEDLSELQG